MLLRVLCCSVNKFETIFLRLAEIGVIFEWIDLILFHNFIRLCDVTQLAVELC